MLAGPLLLFFCPSYPGTMSSNDLRSPPLPPAPPPPPPPPSSGPSRWKPKRPSSFPPYPNLGTGASGDPLRGRTLVLCFDETSNRYNNNNTNVVRLFEGLEKRSDRQVCYYQPGIGGTCRTKRLSFGSKHACDRDSRFANKNIWATSDGHLKGCRYGFCMVRDIYRMRDTRDAHFSIGTSMITYAIFRLLEFSSKISKILIVRVHP